MGREAVAALERRTARDIREYRMLENCSGVVVGVSGGADSVCLLRVLLSLKEQGEIPDIPVRAVHVHHGLRAAADGDEEYVRALAESWNVPLKTVRADVPGYARDKGIGTEEAGRILRRQAFDEEAGEMPGARIALAHHLEDSAETMLFHLCRGGRLAGMAGIRPVRGRVIHPLIGAGRAEIEEYLTAQGIRWRTDESNAEESYTRNFIRGTVMPLLEERVSGDAVKHMAAAALDAAMAEEYLAAETEKAYAACLAEGGAYTGAEGRAPSRGCVYLETGRLAALPPYMRKRVIYLAVTRAAGGAKDIGASHVEAVLKLTESGRNGRVDLPAGTEAVLSYGRLRVEGRPEGMENPPLPARTGFPLSAEDYRVRVIPAKTVRDGEGRLLPAIPGEKAGRYTKWFDYDRITQYMLRSRLPGDHITLSPDGGTKKLSRVMIDGKIPPELRDRIVLPFDGKEALWIPGYRISAAALVTENTSRVLEISLPSGRGSGEMPD